MIKEKRFRFEWDEAKARANKRKHGVSFELAKEVFKDELQERTFRGHEHGEERYWTMGMVGAAVLVVVHIWVEYDEEEDVIRIISARRATAGERRRYEEGT